ncbi:MAG: YciI family protein [Solirubrobacteraceae bacterium]
MKYALLIYGTERDGEPAPERDSELDPGIAGVLAQPSVIDWARLFDVSSATTVTRERGRTLFTDGPFLDSKEYVAGLVIVDAPSLDGALRVAEELQEQRPEVAIEVRPLLEAA